MADVKDYRYNIYINNSSAINNISKLESETVKLERSLEKMRQEGKQDTQEFKNLESQIIQNEMKMKTLRNGIDINTLSLKSLRAYLKTLNNELSMENPGTRRFNELQSSINAANARLRELRGTSQSSGSMMSNMANGFNKYFGMATAAVASITGLSFAFRKLAEDVAKMDDVYSDVMKTTGLTRDQVLDLNESLKQMDTRTSREDLNKLAEEAGKLGIEGKENILDFVDAGNQIKVALGEDLGEDAIKNIGKMVGVFQKSTKELQGIGLKEQMLAVGSAVNELGASSSASEDYLVQFAGRLGGVATQAGIGMDSILGFASALDQDMQQVEMSSTALQQFIMKVMGEPAKFAKLAGLNVKEFSNLLNTDANAAIKQVLKALNEKGGFQALIPVFQEMGLDGARATGVLSSMANSIDKIDEAQKVANQAMIEGISITKEYETKNNNLAAKLDKAKKAFKEQALVLGENLSPALLKSTNATTYLIKGLTVLIPWLTRNATTIISIVSALALYASAQKINNILKLKDSELIKQNLIVQNLRILALRAKIAVTGQATTAELRLIAATKASNAALSSTIWGAVAVAIGFAVGKLIEYVKQTNKLSSVQQLYNDSLEDTKQLTEQNTQSILEEKNNLDSLITSIINTNEKSELRSKLIDELILKYPSLLGNIDKEKISNNLLTAAMASVNEQYEIRLKNAALSAKMQAQQNLAVKYSQRQLEIETEIKKLNDGINTASDRDKRLEKIQELNKEYSALDRNIKIISKNAQIFQSKISKNENDINKQNTIEFQTEELKIWSDAYNQSKKNYQNAVEKGNEEEADFYKKQMDDASGRFDYAKLKISQLKQAAEDAKKNAGTDNSTTPELSDEEKKKKKQQEEAFKSLEKANQDVITQLKQRRLTEVEVERQFDDMLLAQKLAYLKMKLALEQKFAMDTNATQQDLYDTEYQFNKRAEELRQITDVKDALNRKKELGDIKVNQANITDVNKKGAVKLAAIVEENEQKKREAFEADKERQASINQLYSDAIGNFGGMLGEFMTGQEMSTKEFTKNMILLALDVLEKQVMINITAAQAGALASHESIATWGVAGTLKAAVITGMIMAAFQGVKAAVSSGMETGGMAFVTREQDGKMFNASVNPTQRGFINKPTLLVGENGMEQVIPNEGLMNPHIRPILNAIEVARQKGKLKSLRMEDVLYSKPVQAREMGGYAFKKSSSSGSKSIQMSNNNEFLIEAVHKLSNKLDQPLNVFTKGKRSISEEADLIAKMEKNKSRNL